MADDQLKNVPPPVKPTEQDYTLTDPQLRAGMSLDTSKLLNALKGAQEAVVGPTPQEVPGQPEPGLQDVGMLNPMDYAVPMIPGAVKAMAPEARTLLANERGSLNIPLGKKIAKAAEAPAEAAAIDMTPAARYARAKEMGFNPMETWYHGTKADIDQFRNELLGASTGAPSARKGYFFTRDASTASDYAHLSKSRAQLRGAMDETKLEKELDSLSDQLFDKYGEDWMSPGRADAMMEQLKGIEKQLGPEKYAERLKHFQNNRVPESEPLLAKWEEAGKKYGQFEGKSKAIADDYEAMESAIEAASKTDPKYKELDKISQTLTDESYNKQLQLNHLANKGSRNSPEYEKLSSELEELYNAKYAADDKLGDYKKSLADSFQNAGSNVIPAHLKMQNPYIHDFKGQGYRDESYNNILKKAQELGHDSVILKNTYDPANPKNRKLIDVGVVFDPSQVRSKFAGFDPSKKHLPNLSYASGGVVQSFADGGGVENNQQLGMVPIYDISGDQATLGEVPHDDVQAAVVSGKYSLPKGRDVQVIAPDGSLGSVPAEDAEAAFKGGYKYATPALLSQLQEKEHFQSTPQQVLGGLEAVAKGVAGPLAPLAEKGLTSLGVPGLSPEEQRKREEHLGIAAPIAEAAGFIGSMFTGVGEAALLERAGVKAAELASQAIAKGVARSTTEAIGARLASGAAKTATEMALFQAGDEAGKVINDVPNTPGQAAANVGLSALLGGVGGGALTGLGMGAKKLVNNRVLRDMSDEFAVLGSDVSRPEKVSHEFTQAINAYHAIGDEVTGVTGLKAEALANLLPKEITPAINSHVDEIVRTVENKIAKMRADPVAYPERLISKVEADLERFKSKALPEQVPVPFSAVEEHIPDTITMQKQFRKAAPVEAPIAYPRPEKTPGQIFDATDELKKSLQDYSKGNFGINEIPRHHEAFDFLKVTKELGHDIRTGLENPKVWGEAANVQKEINKSWYDLLPFVKQVTSGFMSKVGNVFDVDQAKFNSYISSAGRATTETTKQKQLAGFLKGMDQFHDVIERISKKAGVEVGIEAPALTALRESVGQASTGTKLARQLYEKLGPTGLGDVLGGVTGGAIGHATGIPEMGISGAYLGKWALGPVFRSVIMPILQHGPNLPAFRAATGYAKAVLDGNAQMTNAAAKMFESGAKTIPSHFMPKAKDIKKLDEQVKEAGRNPSRLLNVAKNMEDYMPNHAQALSQTAMVAVNYLNSIRPQPVKPTPLDKEIPPSKSQEAAYMRQLEIAQQPLLVFQHMKDGTLQPQDIKTLKTIYPEYYNKMSQQVMTAMTDHLSKDEHVPYTLRQTASLFLGQPLDSTMTPTSIQSIQVGYAAKSMNKQQASTGQQVKKGTSKLGQTSENMLSPNQARQQRSNQV